MGAGTTDGVRQFLSNVRYLGQIVLDTIIVDRYIYYIPAEVTYDEVNFEKNRDSLICSYPFCLATARQKVDSYFDQVKGMYF